MDPVRCPLVFAEYDALFVQKVTTVQRKGQGVRLCCWTPGLQQQRSDPGFYRVGRSSGALASAPGPFSTPDRSIIWGAHAQSPLDVSKACSRLSSGYIFARSRALITGGQGQSRNSDFGHRFLDCGRLLNSYYEHGHFGLSIWSPPLVATLLSKTNCFPMKNMLAVRQF